MKKIVAFAKEKTLDQKSCSWQRSYQNVKRHKLLGLKYTCNIRLTLNYQRQRRESDLVHLQLALYKTKAMRDSLINSPRDRNFTQIT
jgi:hypothetical protein